MHQPTFAAVLIGVTAASSAAAADLLPLRQGIYVPTNVACKGASNADMVNYWGDRSSIGVAQATCTIKSLKRAGQRFTLHDTCTDIQNGDTIEGGPTIITITGPTRFAMSGKTYRYCGPKPVW